VGAGFSRAVLAQELASRAGAQVLVLDSRPHIAGNCHTMRDEPTGVLVHVYGPHIFNTNNQSVGNT
jgi:UDP-galactopyranose mutase